MAAYLKSKGGTALALPKTMPQWLFSHILMCAFQAVVWHAFFVKFLVRACSFNYTDPDILLGDFTWRTFPGAPYHHGESRTIAGRSHACVTPDCSADLITAQVIGKPLAVCTRETITTGLPGPVKQRWTSGKRCYRWFGWPERMLIHCLVQPQGIQG